jgi:drug/metabolite transporter (DMT)-like permease
VISTASLAELNRRLLASATRWPEALSAQHRAHGLLDAHGEDFIDELQIESPDGPVLLKLVKPCGRCTIPDVDPASAVQGHAVADTLAAYRAEPRIKGGLAFGMNAIVVSGVEHRLRVGARVRATLNFWPCRRSATRRPGSCSRSQLPSGAPPGMRSCASSRRPPKPAWPCALRWPVCGSASPPGAATAARTPAAHARIALQGVFMYSLAYLCVYHAEKHVPSGLVAVGYSASPLVNGIGAWLLWRNPLTPRFVLGGVLCVAGVAIIFAPEFAAVKAGGETLLGALFTVGAVALSAVGSLLASRNTTHRLPFWPTIGWGMVYSAALSALVLLASGTAVALPSPLAAPSWWLSLAYLAIAGSVIAFACYLKLQERIGPGAASTVGVMTPVLALVVSTLFEGFRPVALTWLGVALAVAG